MKRLFLLISLSIFFFTVPLTTANAYMVKYKEDFYKLYHVHYQQYPDDCIENIYWLEKAVQADFCNPLFANPEIKTEKEWEKYRYLFQMHLNLKLIEQHLRLGRTYDKKCIYFYDAPWKDEYLRNMEKALSCYKAGLYYWQEAKVWFEKADAPSFNFLFLTSEQNWEDERERIRTGELNYEKMLTREINRLEKNIRELNEMDKKY
ncbi:MAG: hypothetical protein J5527_00135 [Treponema sp.]|nr:hypothetical protein [Treponema sp.]